MEFSDSEEQEIDSDAFDEELESELYSVLHYNILSHEIPSTLLEKYDIKKNERNEYFISLKNKSKTETVEESGKTTGIIVNCRDKVDIADNVILISDEDSDSVVLINDKTLDVTYISSSSAEEINSETSDMENDLMLNIGGSSQLSDNSTEDDSEEQNIELKWQEVTSPNNWTKSMKKYYNKPCDKLKNFDYNKIREEIKGAGEWHISPADMFRSKKRLKRCTICRQSDHQRKDCPRKFLNCYMCGSSGHNDSFCPYTKCLNCGRRNKVYTAMCQKCEGERFRNCTECQQKGHTKFHCPDTWRRFHCTTKGKLEVKEQDLVENLVCCNCAQTGHLFENCTKIYWSVYPPTSYLVKNTGELYPSPKGKKRKAKDFKGTSDGTPNNPNWNLHTPSTPFNQASTSFKQFPSFTPKRKKMKRNFQSSPTRNGQNINNPHNTNDSKHLSQKMRKKMRKLGAIE